MAEQVPDRLAKQYEQLHVGIAVFDPESGAVVDANGRLEEILGYETDRLRELNVDAYSANTYAFSGTDVIQRVREAADGDAQRFKWRVKRRDGTLLWVQVDVSRLTGSHQPLVIAEVRDITEHTETSRRVGLLSRLMRHNLRNELTVITGRAGQIRDITDSDVVGQQAEKIAETAARIDRMADSVREIERATTPRANDKVRKRTLDAVDVVVDELREVYPEAAIRVEERTEMWFRVDDGFAQALSHAVENAIVHSERAVPEVTVVVDESENTGRVQVRIVDDCPPIPATEMAAIDESVETTDTAHGTGVGLFVMKWCIESLGGEVTFERHGGGNVVSLYLPPVAP